MNIVPEYSPLVSVIIPVKNGSKTIEFCLKAVKRSYYKNFEIIVVDDHSTDNTKELAKRYTQNILDAEDGSGANNARNFGTKYAKGEIFVFIDSDIVIGRETLLGIVEALDEKHIDAVVGIYTAKHRHESFVSQYKNLWVRYSYMKSLPGIDWLFGSISGIRRSAFEKLGGFKVELLARHGSDDIEFGKRFSQAKLKIALDMDIEVEHLKHYNLWSFIKNEFDRSVGFAKLATQLGETKSSIKRGFVNVYPVFVLSTAFSFIVMAAIIAVLAGLISYWWLVGAGGLYLIMNIRFLNYLEQVRGLFAMIVMIPLLFLDHIVCLIGATCGVLRALKKKV